MTVLFAEPVFEFTKSVYTSLESATPAVLVVAVRLVSITGVLRDREVNATVSTSTSFPAAPGTGRFRPVAAYMVSTAMAVPPLDKCTYSFLILVD